MAEPLEVSRIRIDLASFGDPGALVTVTPSGRGWRAEWTMRGKDRQAVFSTATDGSVSVRADGSHLQYEAFIAGLDMADLRHVAQMIVQASKPELFVGTPALEALAKRLDEAHHDATRILMVTGGAGAGKTRVLQELVLRRARAYLRGACSNLLLYVDAQGRALARLNEALATELQDLKVGLTYHSVAVLTRLGILIPVIDGFDELLGVSGYDDAFSSLAVFLEQLEGRGQLLASARSIYYEEEFLARAGSLSATGDQAWSHEAVTVYEWSDEAREEYLSQWAEKEGLSAGEAAAVRARARCFFGGGARELAEKPLFFTRMVGLLRDNPDLPAAGDPLRTLVREYLARERTGKLLDRHGRSLLTEAQFEHLMRELALEMWNQETRELDVRSVREVADYVAETEALSDAAKAVMVERMPTFAFLARGDGSSAPRAGISFEHELFFFYFLAGSIVSQLDSRDADLRIVLSRSALPEEAAERVALALYPAEAERGTRPLQPLLDRLARAGATEWRRTTQVRENAGLLAMALLRERREIDGCTVQSMIFPGSHLRDVTLRRCSLVDVTVRRTSLASTRFQDCEARDVLFFEPEVATDSTRLDLKGIAPADVTGMTVRRGDDRKTTYDPSKIAAALRTCGAPIDVGQERSGPPVSPSYIGLLERLMRAYRRANPLSTSDDTLQGLFTDPDWPLVERLLVEHRLVEREDRSTKGKRKDFLRRRFQPEQLMAGLAGRGDGDARVRAFWRALAEASAAAAAGQ